MYLHEYTDRSMPITARLCALRDRARELAREREGAVFSPYAVRSIADAILNARTGADESNTLLDDARARLYSALSPLEENGALARHDRFAWALDDLVECAKSAPERSLALVDTLTGSAREQLAAVAAACDRFHPGDFHLLLTAIAPDAAADRTLATAIRDGRNLMYLEVTRNKGHLWGEPRADWFRSMYA